jgi:hypothetical protein
VINGPHCPKCGFADRWVWYSGPKDNPDALRCTWGESGADVGCGYIYWRRNAPPTEPTSKEAVAARRAEYERQEAAAMAKIALEDRRARVRALVMAMAGRNDIFFHDSAGSCHRVAAEVVDLAIYMDERIESIGTVTNIQGSDS